MNFSLFNFSFLSLSEQQNIKENVKKFNFEQDNTSLVLIGLESGSSLINVISISSVILFILLTHILVSLLFCYFKCKKIENWATNKIKKIFWFLTFGAYISYMFEMYIFFILGSVSELYYFEDIHYTRRVSVYTAIGLLTLCTFTFIITFFQWCKLRYRTNMDKMYYFTELFRDFKNNSKSRSFWLYFLLRRLSFCSIVLLFKIEWYLGMKIVVFFSFQLSYVFYLLISLPYSQFKLNFLDSVNELIYSCLCWILIFARYEKDWSVPLEYTYIGLMLANNFLFVFISFSKYYSSLFTYLLQSNKNII